MNSDSVDLGSNPGSPANVFNELDRGQVRQDGHGQRTEPLKTRHKYGMYLTAGPDENYLYAIECGPFHKVGLSRKPRQRMNEMLLLNPYEPKIVMCHKVRQRWAVTIERRTHELLAQWHHRREWFTAPLHEIKLAAKVAQREAALLAKSEDKRHFHYYTATRKIVMNAWAEHTPPDLREKSIRGVMKTIEAMVHP